MKFQHLPGEMIGKILDATDFETFDKLSFANRNVHKISNTFHFRRRNLRELLYDNFGIFAVLVDGSRMQIGPRINLPKDHKNRMEIFREMEHVDCLTYRKCTVKQSSLDMVLPVCFPKLKTIRKIQILHCTGEFSSSICDALRYYRIKDLTISKSEVSIDDSVVACLKGKIQIDSGSGVTDRTLRRIINRKRPVFKLKGAVTKFTWEGVESAIEIALRSNWKFDWHFGVVRVDWVSDNMSQTRKCLNPLVWRSLISAETQGFAISFTEEKSFTTIKISRDQQTIQFTTLSVVAEEIKNSYSGEDDYIRPLFISR